jgi:hypothetical protein
VCVVGSAPDPEIVTPTERVVATDTHGTYRTTVEPSDKAHVPVAPSRVFDALKSVYEELGVPPAINDPTTGRLGNTDFWKTRKLGTEPISTYLNCGDSIMGPAADTYGFTSRSSRWYARMGRASRSSRRR